LAQIESGFDKAKAESFAGYAVGFLNGGFLTVMISVGHRTGLFDVVGTMPQSTSLEIAQKTRLKGRYVSSATTTQLNLVKE